MIRFHKYILLPVILLIGSIMNAQTKEDETIDKLISKLNWESVTITCNYVLVLKDADSISNELVAIGKPATEKLINAIKIPEKAIAVHIILTRIYELKKHQQNISTFYIYKDCKKSIGWHHAYNGITWKWIDGENDSVSDIEIKKLYNYWKTKLIDNKKAKLPNNKEVAKAISDEDKKLYPCTLKNFYQ